MFRYLGRLIKLTFLVCITLFGAWITFGIVSVLMTNTPEKNVRRLENATEAVKASARKMRVLSDELKRRRTDD